jgi:hypothetical protein
LQNQLGAQLSSGNENLAPSEKEAASIACGTLAIDQVSFRHLSGCRRE